MKKLIVCLVIFGLLGWGAWGVRYIKYSRLAAKEVSWSDIDLLIEMATEGEGYREQYEDCIQELAR